MVPRVVVLYRPSEYEELLATHGTHGQAAFYLKHRGRDIEDVLMREKEQAQAIDRVLRAIPRKWRRMKISRRDLDRFLFEPEDLVVAVGQDGLVANAAKYLEGQSVIGINPNFRRFDGVLVKHRPDVAETLLQQTAARRVRLESRAMVEARTDDGQCLYALNEIFMGHRSHQSARYVIEWGESKERHSSSGVIVSTGTGATGWAQSIHRARRCRLPLPAPESPRLIFFVREAFSSVATQTELTEGILQREEALTLTSEMNVGGVVFGDGLEADRIDLRWSQKITIRQADKRLRLVA